MARITTVVFALILAGCGSEKSIHEAHKVVKSFKCSHTDFKHIEQMTANHLTTYRWYRSGDPELYQLAKNINAALAKECSVTVREKCSPGNETDKTSNDVIGPINSLGVTASTELKSKNRKDADGQGPVPYIVYEVSIVSKKTIEGLKCYLAATK